MPHFVSQAEAIAIFRLLIVDKYKRGKAIATELAESVDKRSAKIKWDYDDAGIFNKFRQILDWAAWDLPPLPYSGCYFLYLTFILVWVYSRQRWERCFHLNRLKAPAYIQPIHFRDAIECVQVPCS